MRKRAEQYAKGVLEGDRALLARTITLIESDSPTHLETAQEALRRLLPHAGGSIRVGITGVPGVGKSTFIDAFGLYLCQQGCKVAVLAVDPTSSISGGSVLGDKTRMERLSRHEHAFIRPTPSGGALGGVARKSRETILVCEAAGFDVILVETVGVGQSETSVRSMVDFFLLLMLAGAGDDLQGMKKGITEMADAVLITKADGDNKEKAESAKSQQELALHCQPPPTKGWSTRVETCSSITGEGIPEAWEIIEKFHATVRDSGVLEERRQSQRRDWFHDMLAEELKNRLLNDPAVRAACPEIEKSVIAGTLPVTAAVQQLLAKLRTT